MGCASSTPMVATAGSEMLKAATHVAGDVKKQGEAAVEDATQALSSTIDTAKETVGTAVAGITNELGSAFKDGTDALDEAKHKVMEGLHLEAKADAAPTAEPSTSRAPTPALEPDADSLKTSTPEPEIERALANEEEAPPTPKPSLRELAELSAQAMSDTIAVPPAATTVAATAEAVERVEAAAAHATLAAASVEYTNAPRPQKTFPLPPTHMHTCRNRWQQKEKQQEEEELRPSTTEWEKLADQLAKSRKFRPYESFAHSQNHFSVYKDYTSLRDKPGHYDGHFSIEGNSQSSASQSQSDLSSGQPTPAPPRRRGGQREYAKFVGAEQPVSVSRASSRLSNVGGGIRTFDFNPQRERISLPIAKTVAPTTRVGSRSLWARGQPAVLPEEPVIYSPVRRSSLATGLGLRPAAAVGDIYQLPLARSTSNLSRSTLPRKQKPQSRLSTAEAPVPGSRRVLDLTHTEMEPIRAERISVPRPVQHAQERSKPAKDQAKHQLSETLKSMLDSSRDISAALLLATPLTVKSLLHSPSAADQTDTSFKTPTPARATTAAKRGNGKSTDKQATPSRTPSMRSPASFTKQPLEDGTHVLPKYSTTTTPQRINSLPHSPQRAKPLAAAAIFSATVTKSPAASRASSRLSSNSSSTEVVIRPLSHLNTPSAVSLSPDQVVMLEYDDSDLEAALARLADWRGSTITLQSMRSGSSRLDRNSTASRRTSPWIRRQVEHNGSQELKGFGSCGIIELTSPAKAAPQLLERCEICYNEFVMK
ncbi:helicase SRCAP [Drosophila montana]|uniref:helicase SRCAP n=1 Tax=Drosophila montana TaxID=40370 RepID=UPI00313EAB46